MDGPFHRGRRKTRVSNGGSRAFQFQPANKEEVECNTAEVDSCFNIGVIIIQVA